MSHKITLHTLPYYKADLDPVPARDRSFFLLVTGLANELQMLNRTLAVIVGSLPDEDCRIANQGSSAYGMLIARLLAGRLCEGWKILSHFSKPLKAEYEPEMEPEGRRALQEIRAYFNPKRGQECLIWKVRDHIAFHSLSETVEAAYALFEPTDDLGDYLAPTFGNTLYYTTELLQYRALQHLSGADDHTAALDRLITDTQRMTSAFNTAIYAFAGVFFKRFLPIPLSNLMAEAETIDVPSFEDQCLTFFSELPVS